MIEDQADHFVFLFRQFSDFFVEVGPRIEVVQIVRFIGQAADADVGAVGADALRPVVVVGEIEQFPTDLLGGESVERSP